MLEEALPRQGGTSHSKKKNLEYHALMLFVSKTGTNTETRGRRKSLVSEVLAVHV